MKFYDKTKYAFILAIVRAYESKMLNSGDVERMIGAKNAQEAYRVLNDLDYAKFLGDANQVEDFQIVINEGLLEIKEILTQNAPYKELLDILWLKADFSNLKALIKAKIQEKDFAKMETMFLPYAKYSFAELSGFFATEDDLVNKPKKKKNSLEVVLKETIQNALQVYTETENPLLVDACVDQAFYQYLGKFLPKVQSEFVTQYYKEEVDLKNIQIYLRLITLEKTDLFAQLFLANGSLEKKVFEGGFEDFLNNLEKTTYFDLVKRGIENFIETKSFVELEKEADAHLLDYMLKARYINLGIEPLFAFFWIKENNAQIIRTIMVNKLNKIEPVEIRKKIRKLYQ